MAALPEEAKKAVSSMADPQGPSCVLLRSEATSEADVSKESRARGSRARTPLDSSLLSTPAFPRTF